MMRKLSTGVPSAVLAVLAVTALTAAYLAGSLRDGSPAAATAPDESAGAAGVLVTGSGTATGVPDEVRFTVSLTGRDPGVSAALDAASAATRDVVATLRERGVAKEDVQTTGVSVRPAFERVDGARVRDGYLARQRLSVVVRELADAGEAISAVVDAGGAAARVGGVRLQIGDRADLLAQAREDAIAEARARAEQYARALDRPLGEVTSVQEEGSGDPRAAAQSGSLAAAEALDVPIQAGTDDLRVTVAVRWAFAG